MIFAGNWSGLLPKFGEKLSLFRLIIQRSNLVGRTLNLDGGTRPPYNLGVLGLLQSKILGTPMNGDRLKKNFEDLFFFWRTLAPVSLVLGLGLEHFCPWPWEVLSSERLSLALASDFFCVLGLGLEPCVLDSISDNALTGILYNAMCMLQLRGFYQFNAANC